MLPENWIKKIKIVAVSVGFGCVDLDKTWIVNMGKWGGWVSASQAMYFI